MVTSILVVDDDTAVRGLIVRILRSGGHVVVGEAGSAAEALARAEELRPDVALVDIGLPDDDGFSLTRRLRALPWNASSSSPPTPTRRMPPPPNGPGPSASSRRTSCRVVPSRSSSATRRTAIPDLGRPRRLPGRSAAAGAIRMTVT
jgi:hypothetical protein